MSSLRPTQPAAIDQQRLSDLEDPGPTDVADIKRQSVRGGTVTLASQGATVVLQLASTIVLARLLGPAEYGVIAMVTAVTAFAGLFRDLGLSASTIQRDKLSHDQLSTLYWINVGMGAGLTILLALASPLVAWFYGRPELVAVTIAVSLNFLLGSFGTQPGALLNRQMRFGRIAAANLSGAVAGLIVSVIMASQGFSYWSLVFGGIAAGAVTSITLTVLCGWLPGMPVRGAGVRSMLSYGANITAFDVVNYFHRNLDNILIGRIWGADALGLYSRAYSLLMFPISNIRGPLNAVAFPAMSRLQDKPEQLRSYYQRITSLVAFLSMPVMALLFVARRPVVETALGPHWVGVVPVFAALAATGFIQPVVTMFGMVALSAGLGRRYLKLGIFNTICVCLGFGVGVFYGPTGVAVGYGVATYLGAYPLLHWTFSGTPIRIRDFVQAVVRPAFASLTAAAGTLFVIPLLPRLLPAWSVAAWGLVFFGFFIVVFVLLPGGRDDIRRMIAMKGAFQAEAAVPAVSQA